MKVLPYFVWLLTIAAAALSLFAFLGRYSWLAELASHFRVQYAVSFLLAAIFFALCRRWKGTISSLLLASLNGVLIVPLYLPADAPAAGGKTWRVVEANVLTHNTQYEKAREFLRQSKPDIAVILEVDSVWQEELDKLRTELPHRIAVPRDDNFGLAIYSRHEIKSSQTLKLGRYSLPALVVELELGGQQVTVIGFHVLPPKRPRVRADRDQCFAEIAEFAASRSGPVLLVGDLNCTSWSPSFRDLIAESGLRDSRQGFGVQASWPALLPGFRLPIDHCLVSESVAITDRFVGQPIGSDHLPVVIDFRITGASSFAE